ncbi:hypothetical protein NECAME_18047 [Necator americanus]|uniref:Uncharacterized protein n=1 Tax=Necator americanus TaxID=51031 RepID=W2TGD5_NECAM|nr:hypothetical protein NECAME_18047 [Necator americanus]ETN80082.1 hypothetical protein NECAME_18047 [Necator americanus]
MSSLESSPSDAATSRFARKKWSSAFRVVQGLHRFKLPIHRKHLYRFQKIILICYTATVYGSLLLVVHENVKNPKCHHKENPRVMSHDLLTS